VSIIKKHTLQFYRQTCFPVTLLTSDITFRFFDEEDFPWKSHPLREFAEQYRSRFSVGARAFIGLADDTVVYSSWVQPQALVIDELRWTWKLVPGDAVVYDVVTMPDWRGKGIYPDALRRLCGMLAEQGTRHLWIYAERENASSIQGIRKAGFEYHGEISALHLVGTTRRSGMVQGVNA
jgi:GNAT superfamily N-acetyltransferase